MKSKAVGGKRGQEVESKVVRGESGHLLRLIEGFPREVDRGGCLPLRAVRFHLRYRGTSLIRNTHPQRITIGP